MERYYSRVFLYHCVTYGIALAGLVFTISCCLRNPLFIIPGMVMIAAYVVYRHGPSLAERKCRWRKQFYEDVRDAIELKRAEEERQARETAVKQKVARKAGAVTHMYWCLTCGYPYTPSPKEVTFAPVMNLYWDEGGSPVPPKRCLNRDIPQHNVLDKPPKPNSYAWWWFQVNGYEPPDFHPEATRNPFVHEGWGANDEVEAMRKAGMEFYSTHPNHAWDQGCHGIDEIPEWYARRSRESPLTPSPRIATLPS
jgi:hypothetical protein